ncbi:MAG TPA: PAC2 family protein [Dehalococcoidia bacterium]|nr:PAC2 family protein [Dehalococcoidia bacterium]
MVESLHLRQRPELVRPVFIAAFSGWPDAAEVSTTAVRYLVERLNAVRFGDIDPELFYDYSEQRPVTRQSRLRRRVLRWPVGELYAWQSPDRERDLLLLLAPEPHLRWRRYCTLLMDLARSFETRLFITLGGTYDVVPHSGRAKVTGWASAPEWTRRLRDLDVSGITYEGPTGIHSALLDACSEATLPTITLWGHAPQYVRSTPNPKVCHASLDRLRRLLGLELNLDRLRAASLALDERVNQAIRTDPQLAELVRNLEAQFEVLPEEATESEPPPLPDSQSIVRELEEFLRGNTGRPADEEADEGP